MPAWVWWTSLGIIYLILLIALGVATFRRRRYVLFGLGFLFPILWLVGAVLKPR